MNLTKLLAAAILLAPFCTTSCGSGKQDKGTFREIGNERLAADTSAMKKASVFRLDSIWSSYVGKLQFHNDGFCFIDERMCKIHIFDKFGKYIRSALGRGRSVKEIDGDITGYTELPDGNKCISSGTKCMIYNKDFERTGQSDLNRDNGAGHNKNNPSLYSMDYFNFILKSAGNLIYYNVTLQHPDFNFIKDKESYYKNAKVIFAADRNSGDVVKMIGSYPECYLSGQYNQFSLVNFDVSTSGKVYVSYEASEKIFVYDESFNPSVCFGRPGRNMNMNCSTLLSFDSFSENFMKERDTYSYYRDIEYIDSSGDLYRLYVKDDKDHDGMQIYDSEGNLTGDIQIPKNLKIAGHDNENLYLYGIDEKHCIISIYTINII